MTPPSGKTPQGTRLGEVIWMNVNDFMAKHGITDADLDRMAAPYDGGSEPEPDGKVFSGSRSTRSEPAA